MCSSQARREVNSSSLHLHLSSTSSDEDEMSILEVSGSREQESSLPTTPLPSNLSAKAPEFQPIGKILPRPQELVSKVMQTFYDVQKFFISFFCYLSNCVDAKFTNFRLIHHPP